METLPALSHEVWQRTPPEAQAYIRALEARVATLAGMRQALQAPDSIGFRGKKPKPLILLRLFHHYSDAQTLFKRHGEPRNHDVSGFHHLRPIGPPLNSMECGISHGGLSHTCPPCLVRLALHERGAPLATSVSCMLPSLHAYNTTGRWETQGGWDFDF